jgi:lysophospholipid acyltransferase (LPLAT)-like uncharacterized protein
MKKILKSLKTRLPANFLPFLFYLAIRGLYATIRVRVVGAEIPEAFYRRGEGLIFAFWHGRMILSHFAYRGAGAHVLVSTHGDGELIARVMQYFGIRLVRGSSTKGGKEALEEMLHLARQNRDLVITPDGPRGPVHRVKPGVAQLARRSGLAVMPYAFAVSRGKELRSWDRFLLPYPFSRAVHVCGEPIRYREGEDSEAFRLRIEQALIETTAKADGYFRR